MGTLGPTSSEGRPTHWPQLSDRMRPGFGQLRGELGLLAQLALRPDGLFFVCCTIYGRQKVIALSAYADAPASCRPAIRRTWARCRPRVVPLRDPAQADGTWGCLARRGRTSSDDVAPSTQEKQQQASLVAVDDHRRRLGRLNERCDAPEEHRHIASAARPKRQQSTEQETATGACGAPQGLLVADGALAGRNPASQHNVDSTKLGNPDATLRQAHRAWGNAHTCSCMTQCLASDTMQTPVIA